MMPSVRASRWNAASASSSVAPTYSARPVSRSARVLRADARDSRARPRSSARRAICPSSSASSDERAPWRTPGRPVPRTPRRRPRRRRAARPRRRGSRRTSRSRSSRRRRRRPRPRAAGPRPRGSARAPRSPITRLELAHDLRVRRRADAGADQVVRRLDVRDPVADRLARRLLQRPRAELDRAHLGAEQLHPLDVGRLPAHVLGAHVDDAVEAEARADGRGRDAVLARAGLGDDPPLAEPAREQRLAERVVELVRAGVEQVLALQVEPLPGREALGPRERRRAAGVRRSRARGARAGTTRRASAASPAGRELVERRDQRLGHVAPAVVAVGQASSRRLDVRAQPRRGP